MREQQFSYRENDPIFAADEEARHFGEDAFNLTTGTLFTDKGDDLVPLPIIAAMESLRNDGDLVTQGASYAAKGRHQERLGELALDFLHAEQRPPISYFTSEGGSGALMHILNYLDTEGTPFHKRQKITDAKTMPLVMTSPKWPNHPLILKGHGYHAIRQVPHLTPNQAEFNISGLVRSLHSAKRAILLLQTQPHNPTGKNPTKADWQTIAEEAARNRHVVILDSSFPGFCKGLSEDMEPSRILAQQGVEHFNAISLSKIFGIPAWRTGLACHVHGAAENPSGRTVKRDTLEIRNLASWQLRNADTLGTYCITHALENHASLMRSELEKIRCCFSQKTKRLGLLLPEFQKELEGEGQFRYIDKVSHTQTARLKEVGIFLAPVEQQKGAQGVRLNIGRLPLGRTKEFAKKFRSVMLP